MSDHVAVIEADEPSTLAGWFAVTGGIVAWLAHITALSALVAPACGDAGAEWAMHAATAACSLMTVAALVVAMRLARRGSRPWRFLGQVGVISSATNLVLILFEGSYVLFFGPCS
jgi:hypothetical protein